MIIKSNPSTILNAKVVFFGKGGFSSLAKATKISLRLPWMRKAKTFDIEVKGRRTKKKVSEAVTNIIHSLEVARSKKLSKAAAKRREALPVARKAFDPYDFKVNYREETFYSKTLGSFIQANKIRYSYKQRYEFNEQNNMKLLKPLYGVVKDAAQDFFFDQNAYGDFLQIKIDFTGKYHNRRRSKVPETMSFSFPRSEVPDPDYVEMYVKDLFNDFLSRLRSRITSENYFRIKMRTETYFLAGFTIERVFRIKV